MELNSLPKLVRFCYGDYIEFPMLRKLRMYWCLKFTTFVSKFMIGDEPQVDPNILRNNSNVDDDLCLFNDKVAFPMLQKLQLNFIGDDKWMNIWHDKLTSNSFGELKYLELEFCSVWSIFPFSIVDRLKKLETMDISYCSKLESIIEPCRLDQSNESSTKFVFPQVSYLRLDSLRKLKSFYPRMHITQWPSLKELRVTKCNNVKIFTLNNLINSQLEIPADEQPLFWFSEDAFPCLEELYTDQDDAEEIFELAKYQESTIN
ncbi:hypothetical protein COLO4_13568 [Corchorus olitorius]|uniref:Disease resistance protein At4g27190-like leucine-rich repeats domain-containing protein n=1 Tax=Corchorus olitorius TaxID=93759 RepID=A0A1R3JW31_9ROSI|nr:hypothetical protein COLO4_13568 [Corchorus olitorius]